MKSSQFYLDTINKDLLKILGFSTEVDLEHKETFGAVEYVRCACISNNVFFGIQEMKTVHLHGARFIRVPWYKQIWFKWKWRDSRLSVPKRDLEGKPVDRKPTY